MDFANTDIPKIPDYELSEKEFLIKRPITSRHREETLSSLIGTIKEEKLSAYYHHLRTEVPNFPFDEGLYETILKANEDEINELKQKIKESEEDDEGELDILGGWTKLGEFYAKIGDKANSITTLKKALELAPSTGSKIDLLLTITRIGFFFNDFPFVLKHLDQVKLLIDKGGDWERRNRYKTYLGIYLMATRNFSEAAKLLIESLATFTSTEICSYEQLAQYAIITGALSLDRTDLKTKIIDSPEILSIYSSSPALEPLINLTNSLYTCDYSSYFQFLLETNDVLFLPNKYLAQHSNYFLREMRCKAYTQLLESYRSLSIKSMAESFNISEEFLDADLCKFIPNKKLNCIIDKVNGIIETNRPDNKNNQYQSLVKTGDTLLTKLQKYGAAVKLSGAERVV